MTKQVWKVERTVTDVTAQIMSMQYSTGRRTQFDSWSPGFLNFTIKNDNGQANNYELNETITLTAVGASFFQWFYVQEVLFNDLGGEGKGSTATIICTDLLGRMGRIQVFEKNLVSAGTVKQLFDEFNSLMPTGTNIAPLGNGDSTAAADASYSGTVLNRVNLNMTTEQGLVQQDSNTVYLFSRSNINVFGPGVITFARSASGSYQMGYSDIKRIALGSNYLNNCTVTPPVAAARNDTDATGVAAYGTYGAEFATVDNTAAQAKSFAQWQVQSRADPDQLSFQISVSDTANDLTQLFVSIYSQKPVVTVSYKNPGDAATYTSSQIIQGWSMTITPSRTDMEIFTSPLTYTNFFTLNSNTFGVLDKSRLGW
tara:strand:- start:3061 stop:4170 length:1110 start_codon:yes stop_codon:yes gene_type:complete